MPDTNRDLESDVAQGHSGKNSFLSPERHAFGCAAIEKGRRIFPCWPSIFLKNVPGKNRKSVKGFVPLAMDVVEINYNSARERQGTGKRHRASRDLCFPGEYITEKQLPLNITEKYPDLKHRQPLRHP